VSCKFRILILNSLAQVLQKPPDDKMWDALCRYTSRVHSITQQYNSASMEALSSILLSCPLAPASLFPNLRQLTWVADGTCGVVDFLRMAFVPTLLVLDVVIYSTSPAFLSVLSSLGTLCPRLQSMTLSYYPLADRLVNKFSPFIIKPISKLHHLRALEVWDLGDQGIRHIMELQALQSLTLNLTVSSTWEKRSHLQLPGFRDLHSLTLSINKFEHACNFLAALEVVRSRDIKIFFCPQSQAAARGSTMLSQFLDILQERCDNDKLQCFSLLGYLRIALTVASGVFTSFHTFRNITQLDIQEVCDVSVSDMELCQLVRAWPKLQILKFSRYVTIDTATVVPTFHGLIGLLRLCPALTSLALVIDTTKLDDIDLINPSGGCFNTCLNNLALGNSLIDSPVNVALILSGLLPRLDRVNLDCWNIIRIYDPSQGIQARKEWESVNSILRGFGVLRERRIEA